MLYVLHADGTVDEIENACFAKVEPSGEVVCFDERGYELARYPKSAITAYGREPIPVTDEPVIA